MWSAASVLVCAIELMGRSVASFPPIEFVDIRPPGVSAQAEAFVRVGENTIYLLTSTPAFQRAQSAEYKCGHLDALRKIASILVHEEWHVRKGPDERGAYQAQLMALALLRAGPGHPIYFEVLRAMKVAVKPRARQPELRAAAD